MSIKLVDWSNVISADLGAKVLFSALALPPHRDEIDANLVAIEMPGDIFIDVDFAELNGLYTVTMFKDDFDDPIASFGCDKVPMAIAIVSLYAESTRISAQGPAISKRHPGVTYANVGARRKGTAAKPASDRHANVMTPPLELI